MNEEPHWAVCRTFSFRVHRVRPEIEKTNHGTFLPTYARAWVRDGELCIRERLLMPGYLFFMTEPEGWADVRDVEGVHSVLSNNGRASKVLPGEMLRLVVDHATGAHNSATLDGLNRRQRTKRERARRPRASKRARAA
jgi:transcription antitermination factor NusG